MRRNVKKNILIGIIIFLSLVLVGWNIPLLIALIKPKLVPTVVSTGKHELTIRDKENQRIYDYLEKAGVEEAYRQLILQYIADKKDMVVYPSLAIITPLHVTTADATNIQDWKTIREQLSGGVSATRNIPTINNNKTLYVIGHSSDYNVFNPYSAVFASLGQAQNNDLFIVIENEIPTVYRVTDKNIISPNHVEAYYSLAKADESPARTVLVTCWPLLTTQSRLMVTGIAI